MLHSSYIELNKTALTNNINFIKTLLPSTTQLSAVVKGNAYGHGIENYIPIAEDAGINNFSVYKMDEAQRVFRTLKKKATILIMGFIDLNELLWVIENEVEFFVYDDKRLIKAIEIAKKLNKKAIIHIEIETGLNRTGYLPKNIPNLSKIVKENSNYLNVKGTVSYTHLTLPTKA